MVWAASSPACCCWKKTMMLESVHSIPLHASPFIRGGGPIWKESHLKQAVWKAMGRMDERTSAQVTNWAEPCFCQATCTYAFPTAQPSHMACPGQSSQLSSFLLLLGPGEMPAFLFSDPLPLGPHLAHSQNMNLSAGGWLAQGRHSKQGRG